MSDGPQKIVIIGSDHLAEDLPEKIREALEKMCPDGYEIVSADNPEVAALLESHDELPCLESSITPILPFSMPERYSIPEMPEDTRPKPPPFKRRNHKKG